MSTSLEDPRMAADTEVVAKAQRRRFTAAEKLRVLKEADRCTKPGELGAPLRRGRRGEAEWTQEAAVVYGDVIVQGMQTGARDMRTYHGRCKRACVLHDWLKGTPVRTIEDRFSKGPFASLTFGNTRGYADGTRFWLGSAVEILQLVLLGPRTFTPGSTSC